MSGWKTRRFGSHVYYMYRFFDTKAEATQRANALRNAGNTVKITTASRPKGYVVWTRRKGG